MDEVPVTRAEFDALRTEVAALRAAVGGGGADGAAEAASDVGTSHRRTELPVPGDRFWALEGLRARTDDPAGAVLLTGSVELEADVPHVWQQGATVASLLETEWAELASVLDALGHPVRLQLLRLVAGGVRRTADLGEAEGLGTSGQLHHHLRLLVAAGWLRSAGRGRYEIPAPRVVPLLVILAAAQR